MKTPGMIGVEVGQHHPAYLLGIQPAIRELWADLFLRPDPFLQSASKKRMPAREIARFGNTGCLSGVNDDQTFRVLDHPGENWQPVAPGNAGVGAQPPEQPVAFAADLVRSDSDRAGLDRVDGDPARRHSSGIRLCSVQGLQGGCHDVSSSQLISWRQSLRPLPESVWKREFVHAALSRT